MPPFLRSTSDLIAPIDADDVVLSNHLELLESGFRSQASLDLCFGDAESFRDGELCRESYLRGSAIEHLPCDEMTGGLRVIKGKAYPGIVNGNRIATPATLYRRETAPRIGLYDPTFPCCNDREFLLRMSCHAVFGYFPETVVRVRLHNSNLTHSRNRHLHLEQQIRVLRKMLRHRESLGLMRSRLVRL